MSWARSLGEFGATLLFAGNLTGRTQTLPLAVYTAMESDLRAAQALSLVMVCCSLSLPCAWSARLTDWLSCSTKSTPALPNASVDEFSTGLGCPAVVVTVASLHGLLA